MTMPYVGLKMAMDSFSVSLTLNHSTWVKVPPDGYTHSRVMFLASFTVVS